MTVHIQRLVFPAVILVIFIVILIKSQTLPATSRLIPQDISVLAIFLLVFQMIEDIKGSKVSSSKEHSEEHHVNKSEVWWKNKSLITGLGTMLFIASINFVGYVVSTLLFMAALMYLLGLRGKLLIILSPMVAIAGWVIFGQFFGLELPRGWLF